MHKLLAEWISKYKHALLLIYYPVMLLEFAWLEKRNANVMLWIKSPLDDLIPFVSIFVIPYMIWFFYIGITLAVFGFKDKDSFIKMCMSLYIGMTICNLVYFLIPHGQPLRVPLTSNETDVFRRLVYTVYANDTPTNCAPSIHVLFSLATNFAIQKSDYFRNFPPVRIVSNILNLLIILSTMFIKQHSVIDVALGLILGTGIYLLVYYIDWKDIRASIRKAREERRTERI